jgi:hypothetical protein
MNQRELLGRWEPMETLPVWAFCWQAEVAHVAGAGDVARKSGRDRITNREANNVWGPRKAFPALKSFFVRLE